MAGAAVLALASCSSSGSGESAAEIEQATNAGREAARKFVNTVWTDTLALQTQLLEARANACRYDTASPRQKAAYDSAFVSTIRTIRPEIARELEKASAKK